MPIILDGENAWEYYAEQWASVPGGVIPPHRRRFFDDGATVSEALAQVEPSPIDHIFPGSWINANFDVWIGAEEDNRAWDYLLRARRRIRPGDGGRRPAAGAGKTGARA